MRHSEKNISAVLFVFIHCVSSVTMSLWFRFFPSTHSLTYTQGNLETGFFFFLAKSKHTGMMDLSLDCGKKCLTFTQGL